jgi:hypothetical protein
LDLSGERIPLEDGRIDTDFSTFALCTNWMVVEVIATLAVSRGEPP